MILTLASRTPVFIHHSQPGHETSSRYRGRTVFGYGKLLKLTNDTDCIERLKSNPMTRTAQSNSKVRVKEKIADP